MSAFLKSIQAASVNRAACRLKEKKKKACRASQTSLPGSCISITQGGRGLTGPGWFSPSREEGRVRHFWCCYSLIAWENAHHIFLSFPPAFRAEGRPVPPASPLTRVGRVLCDLRASLLLPTSLLANLSLPFTLHTYLQAMHGEMVGILYLCTMAELSWWVCCFKTSCSGSSMPSGTASGITTSAGATHPGLLPLCYKDKIITKSWLAESVNPSVLLIHSPALLFGARSALMTIVLKQIIISSLQITKALL